MFYNLKFKIYNSQPRLGWFFLVTGLVLIAMLFSKRQIELGNSAWWGRLGSVWAKAQVVEITPNDPNPMPTAEADRLDLLVLGLRGADEKSIAEEGGLLTDSIMLISLNTTTRQASIVSIPRDIYINMTVAAKNGAAVTVHGKLNEVYERGLAKNDGIGVTKKIFSRLTGIYIDNVAVFDFSAFQSIIDKLGGIDVTLAKEFREPTQFGYEFYLPAGSNHLDGEQALYYVRSRFASSDFDRAHRQQTVLAAMRNKALAVGLLSDPGKLLALYSELKRDITTDLSLFQIQDIYQLAKTLNPKTGVTNFVLSIDNVLAEGKNASKEYILSPKVGDWSEIKKMFAKYGKWEAALPSPTR